MAVVYITDGNDDGSCMGYSASEKISFHGATPRVQDSHIADATDASTTMAKLNLVLALLENLGFLASS